MKKEIIKKFLLVLSLAIVVTALLFLITVSVSIQNSTKEDMRLNLLVLDNGLDFEADLQPQISDLSTTIDKKVARYTIIDLKGNVLADTLLSDAENIENHANREEFVHAMSQGIGFASRYSESLNTPMLYTAIRSTRADCILRIAIPFRGNVEYLKRLLPAIIISITIASFIAFISAEHLVQSLTKPFNSIVDVMVSYDKDHRILEFEETPYEELNIITDAAVSMSTSVEEYRNQLEFERMVRQEFFANASHELKTPITSIRGYIELLLGGFTTDKETQKDFMYRVLSEIEHISTLINDILLIAQLESNEYEVSKNELRMAIVLEDVISSIKPIAMKNNITITCECKPIVVIANYEHIRQILSNFISNAVKYNKPNGMVNVILASENEDLKIIVSDTGVGIPPDVLSRVFERFFRVDKGRSRQAGGTGLGLSIVKHIANYYQGTVSVKSELDLGSTFTCILPKIIV